LQREARKVLSGMAAGIIGAIIAMGLWSTGMLNSWEAITFDLRARALAQPGQATNDIRLILLDQKTLDWAKEEFGLGWPWPRQAYVPLVDFCYQADAASLTFDVVFTEPSVYGVSDDQALGEAFMRFGRVILPADFAKLDGSDEDWPRHAPLPTITTSGPLRSDGANVATFPIEELAARAAAIGNVNVSPDPDTVYRRIPLFVLFDEHLAPSLPLATALVERENPVIVFEGNTARIRDSNIHIDDDGAAILNYRGKNAYKAYSAAAVMESGLLLAEGKQPLIDLADFKGKHVLFGFSATGLYDLRPTPMGGTSPGVMINATTLDNLLSSDFMRKSTLSTTMMATLLFAVLTGISVMAFRGLVISTTTSALSITAPIILSLVMYRMGIWFDLAIQFTGCGVTLFLAGTLKYATEGRQKRFIKSAFKQYLSPHVIEQLLQDPDKLTLGGERRELTIFFSDLQGFTTISEGLSPEELTSVLNDYLTAMTDIIQDTGGTVDKYEGDAIIAFWNAPVDQPDHAKCAVSTALRCQEKLTEMRPALLNRTGKEFHMRIGINTGPAVVGNLGSHTRFDYTMLGDSVNLAARLEGINKQFDTYTMISKATLDQLDGEFAVRELSRVRVVGKSKAVTVYEPMADDDQSARKDTLDIFAKGLAKFYSGDFTEAVTIFEAIAKEDPAAVRYASKCTTMASNPPEDWDGVWTMTSK